MNTLKVVLENVIHILAYLFFILFFKICKLICDMI